MLKEITQCRVCGNKGLAPVLDLGKQAVAGIFPASAHAKVPEAALQLVKCHGNKSGGCCNLLQLKHSYVFPATYWEGYGYRSGLNAVMASHLHDIAGKIMKFKNLKSGDLIIDIRSNDATLLKAFPKGRFILAGIDPAERLFKKYYPGHIRLIPGYFCAEKVKNVFRRKKAKVIAAIAVFYNVEDPVDFMKQAGGILDDDGIVILEQAYMPLMLKNRAYDAICHEHREFYGLAQIGWIARLAGLKIIDVELNSSNGGSFLVTLAKINSSLRQNTASIRKLLDAEAGERLHTLAPYFRFRKEALNHRRKLQSLLRLLKSRGKCIIGYGAATKGNVLLQFCGITRSDIPAIAEINSDKFNRYTPGSRIPIIPEKEARALHPDYLFVLPWHFKDAILQKERSYVRRGGRLLFPLPAIETVGKWRTPP